jgi:uncharacterized protein YacL
LEETGRRDVIKLVFRRAFDAVGGAFGLVALAPALVLGQPAAAPVYTMTAERIAASTGALVGLIGAVVGGLALARSVRRIGNSGRRGAILALVLGPLGLVIGGLVVASAESGVGTGKGVAGGIVAIVAGLISTALGGLALARSRRVG